MLKTNTNLWCFREISKPYIQSLNWTSILSIQAIISKNFISVTNVKNKDQISCQHNQEGPWESFLGKMNSRPESIYRRKTVLKFKWKIIQTRHDKSTNKWFHGFTNETMKTWWFLHVVVQTELDMLQILQIFSKKPFHRKDHSLS